MARIDIKGMRVEVDTDLYVAGRTEDGSEFTAEVYRVSVVQPNGKRWVHNVTFEGAVKEMSPDGFDFFGDVRKSARKSADYLARRVSGRGYIDTNCWGEGRPVYGSDYYCENVRGD